MTTLNFMEPVTPSEADTLLAKESTRRLTPALAKANGSVLLHVGEPDGTNEPVSIPTAAFRLLVSVLDQMARGNAVRLIPILRELTTQEAAELLNVSRPFVVKLADEGKIPSHLVGTHRRLQLEDVMTYKAEHRRLREQALDRLSDLDQELWLT